MIGRHAVHIASRGADAAEEVAATDDQADLDAGSRDFGHFGGQPMETLLVNTKTVSTGENFAA
jgi:hypothetical protein